MNCIIIGAGAAGLMAARELAKHRHSVILLEARDRIGGRICTLESTEFSRPVETGAEFLHGEVPVTFSLMDEAGVCYREITGEMYQVENGAVQQESFFDESWEQVLHALKKLKRDMTMGQFLDQEFPKQQYPHIHHTIRRYTEGYNAADVYQASAQSLYQEWSEDKEPMQYRPEGGYGRMLKFMTDQLQRQGVVIHTSSVVSGIRWKPGDVMVNTQDGRSFHAEKILITVPVSVLASGALAFTPSLPAYQSAAGQIGIGGVIKFLFEFHEPFWEKGIRHPMPSLRFLFSDATVPTWWSQLPDATPLLTGWLGGPSVATIPDDKQALFGRALQSLAYAFGCDESFIRGKLKTWRVDHWLVDPFSLGAYSYDKIGSTEARTLLNTALSDTVYFAGEALYSGSHTGTVEAALTSGRDAAKKMMREE